MWVMRNASKSRSVFYTWKYWKKKPNVVIQSNGYVNNPASWNGMKTVSDSLKYLCTKLYCTKFPLLKYTRDANENLDSSYREAHDTATNLSFVSRSREWPGRLASYRMVIHEQNIGLIGLVFPVWHPFSYALFLTCNPYQLFTLYNR